MGYQKIFENMIESRLLDLHCAYIAKILSTDGKTAKIQPLGKTKQFGEAAKDQAPITNVPIIESARYKYKKKTLEYVSDVSINTTYSSGYVTSATPILTKKKIDVVEVEDVAAGDIVICVCCDRDITEARKGNNSVPSIGHHSMSSSVIVGVIS